MSFIPAYILILFFLIIIDYFAGILIEKSEGKRRKVFLIASLIANIGTLCFFKYFNFVENNLAALAGFIHWNYPIKILEIALPIGLSFHTFQSMSYVIEVYRKKQKVERHFGIYALYVMFFPQLVAGPIERPYNLIHQFYEKHFFEYKRVTDGLKLMLWGLFKKVVIADRLAIFVNAVYNDPTSYSGLPLIISTVFFAFQIYCDFSGYTDIAIGSAQVMGFKLMDNFNRPYHSKSIAEFWRRWHISLSTWFRDYLYIPLRGNRVSKLRYYFNIIVVFFLSGFWHGANWTFAIWGLLHGAYMIASNITKNIREKIALMLKLTKHPTTYKAMQIIATFTLVTFAWIFFRANNIHDAVYIITHLFSNLNMDLSKMIPTTGNLFEFIIAILSIIFMEIIHVIQAHGRIRTEFLTRYPIATRWAIYIIIIWALLLLGVFGENQFIYFQF